MPTCIGRLGCAHSRLTNIVMPWSLHQGQLDPDACSKSVSSEHKPEWETCLPAVASPRLLHRTSFLSKATHQDLLSSPSSSGCSMSSFLTTPKTGRSSFLTTPTDEEFESYDADYEAYGLPNYSRIVGKDLLHGWHHAQHSTSALAKHCSKNFFNLCSKTYDYVCDTTVPTLHWKRNCGVIYMLSPAEGTGCHTYKFVKGQAPDCKPGQPCGDCQNTHLKGEVVCTVGLHGGDCEDCKPSSTGNPDISSTLAASGPHGVPSAAAFL